jgi:hypothetical protein
MPMFSFDKSSCESKLVELLQARFFITARRNKILAKWAGGRLGYRNGALNKYIQELLLFYLATPDDRKMVDRILADFRKAGIKMSEGEVYEKVKSVEERVQAKAGSHHAH